jgi:DNA-binding transcriptional MerR regulator
VTWTLEQLAERAARALVDAEVRVANGRVTGVPDGRLIRWYATIGLVDRPLTGPGRVARYGIRHLRQLVAVKRLQAQGLPLAEIQHRLAGATDATLRRIAALPPGLDVQDLPVPTDRKVRLHDLSERGDHAAGADVLRPPRRAPARNMPEPATPKEGVSSQDSPAGVSGPTRFWSARPVAADVVAGGRGVDAVGDTVTRVYGVQIHGLLLLLPAEPAEDDIDAMAAAAQPLLDLLAERGLLHRIAEETPREGAPS